MNQTLLKKISLILSLVLLSGWSALAQQNFTLYTTYDTLGQPLQLEYPDGSTVTYTYANEVGVADTVTYAWGVHSVIFVDAIELDVSGLLQTVSTANGQKSYVFDSLNQLVEERLVVDGRTEYLAQNLSYNDQAQLKSVTRQDTWMSGQLRFEYTEQGQLRKFILGGQTATYRYDNQGNLTSSNGLNTTHLEVPNYQTDTDTYDERNRHQGWEWTIRTMFKPEKGIDYWLKEVSP